ncbi:MAG: prolipoprotein diacylglyceryl transferase [Bacteroidota bacterium]
MAKILLISWGPDPEIFSGFPYFRWYSLFWGAGIYLSFLVMAHIFRRDNRELRLLDQLALNVMIGVVIGARMGHVLFYDPIYYLNNPIEILPFRINPHFEFTGLLGLASHGGVLGGLLALVLFNRRHKIGFYWALDRLVIVGALLGACIRVGNFFNSEIIGVPTDLPWAVVFIRVDAVPRHPTQLYEACYYLMVFFLLYTFWRKNKKTSSGFLTGLGLTLLFTQRFLIEFLKEDQVAFESDLILNMGQILSIPIAILGFILMAVKRKPAPPE